MEYVTMVLYVIAAVGWGTSLLGGGYSFWKVLSHLVRMISYQDRKSTRGLYLRHERMMLIWLLTFIYILIINALCLWSIL